MYKTKDFSGLLGSGILSDELFNTHFKLYDGYVNNVNKLLEILDSKEPGTVEYAEIQRRFGWEWDGMRLHELYFENITKDSEHLKEDSDFGKILIKIYGSFEKWETNAKSIALMRGIGWVVLYYDNKSNELFNIWVDEHDKGHLVGAEPLLVIDCFEHAYFQDYGSKRPDYIEQIFSKINWSLVSDRFKELS